MLENKLYKKNPKQTNTRERQRNKRNKRGFSDLQSFLASSAAQLFLCFFLQQKPIYLYRYSKEILCAFSFSLKLASVSIISGVEFRVRISCFLKLDSSVFGAEIGTESHSIQIKDFINICGLVARSSFFFL